MTGDCGRLLIGAFDDVEEAASFASKVAFVEQGLIRREWSRARDAFLATAPKTLRLVASDLDPQTLAALSDRMQSEPFRSSVTGRKWRLANVPLAELLTTQPHVSLSRVRVMTEKLQHGLLSLLFPTATTLNVRGEAAPGPTITLISDRRELIVTSATASRLNESGAIEIVMRIEPRPNYISVLVVNQRLLVRNGNHRLVAAWQSGVREVPCVVFEGDSSMVIEKRWNKFGLDALLSDRPPRLLDLCADGGGWLEAPLRQRRFVTRVRAEQESSYENQ